MKLISLNIEGRRHLQNRVLPFLKKETADVVCLQEVFACDIPVLESEFNMTAYFSPMTNVIFQSVHQDPFGIFGNAILSRFPIIEKKTNYYVGSLEKIPIFFQDENPNSTNRALSWIKFENDHQRYIVATTHFTWSPEGKYTQLQKDHSVSLLKVLENMSSMILCGDLNSPRGSGGLFDKLAQRYKDNIPSDIRGTIDGRLHKSGKDLNLVVDALFSTPDYQVSDVRVEKGVSDHCAIVAKVDKK